MSGPIVNIDRAHGGFKEHVDMIQLTNFGGHKIRVGENGKILSDELLFSKKFMRKEGHNKSAKF